MTQQNVLLQISSTIDLKIGGPAQVIRQSGPFLDVFFNHKLIVVGNSRGYQGNVVELPAVLDNRYGIPFFSGILILKREIHDSEIILIHGFYLFTTIVTLIFSKSKSIYLMPHGSFELYGLNKSKIRKIFFKRFMGYVTNLEKIHFMTASESEAKQIRKQFPKNSISVVGIGVRENMKLIREPKKEVSKVLQLLTIARIDEVKRLDCLIYAVAELRKAGMPVELTVIGSGKQKLLHKLKIITKRLNLTKNIKFVGFIESDRKFDFIDNADIFVLSSDNENFGIAAAEAVSRGIPVVLSKNVGFSAFVHKYEAGLVTKTNSPLDLSTAILSIAVEYSKFESKTRLAAPFLGWEKVIQKWEKTLMNYREGTNC